MNTDVEKIILHIQLQAWDNLHEDEIQTALQTLNCTIFGVSETAEKPQSDSNLIPLSNYKESRLGA